MGNQIHAAPRILIVEDEQLVAMDVEMQLSSFGYEIAGMADSGAETLRLVDETRPDLILMDINLRGSMNGVAIAAQLRRSGIATPILFVTAYGSGEALRRAETVSFHGYITKPYRPVELHTIVRSAL